MTATTNQIFLNGNTLYHLIAFYKLIMWFVCFFVCFFFLMKYLEKEQAL